MSTVAAPPELQRGWVVSGGSFRSDTRVGWQTFPWRRASIVALLALATILYVWDLGASGWGNSFYAAAVQAATKSWKAFLFGSFDSSNFITVDKPPASLWVMDISARIFGSIRPGLQPLSLTSYQGTLRRAGFGQPSTGP